MRTTFKILFFMLCLNLGCMLVYALNLPGTMYTLMPIGQYENASLYEERFNATNLLDEWSDNALKNIPYLGNIASGATLAYNAIRFLIWGFPDTLDQFSGLISSESGRVAYDIVVNALRALFAVVTAMFVIEFITGRPVTE